MKTPWTLARRLLFIGSAVLVLALGSIGLTLWVSWQLEGGAAAVNEAGRMRMQTWRLAASLHDVPPAQVQAQFDRFQDSLDLLAQGDPSRPLLVPWNDAAKAAFHDVVQQWRGLHARWAQGPQPEAAAVRADAESFVRSVDLFVAAIELQLARFTSILHLYQLAMLGLALAAAVVLLYTGYLFVLEPLARLQRGLQRMEQADFAARVEVQRMDEFGRLAAGFNRMAQTLQSLYRSLEDKVREKTASLELERGRLAALYEVSALLARADTLDGMAQGFATKVRRLAHADAVAIRWSDEANQRYLLLAGAGLPKALSEGEHCVATGECLCGQSAMDARTRVIPIVTADRTLGHCAREGFRTLVSVPVRLQQRLLGEVDLFFRAEVALGAEERSLLDALASHLAGAMEGLRAAALERETAVAEERSFIARELHDSIAQSLAFLKIQVQLLRAARGRGDEAGVERTLGELDTGVNECMGDVRELLVHFRTRTNAEHIEPALRTTLQKFEHQTGLKTHLEIDGHGLPLDPDVQVQVLHVVQEALSNVRKHAHASQVWVEVAADSAGWRFEVRDDGQGFEPEAERAETHVGLRIMRERAARIGAQVCVDAVPGAGSCVTLTLPPSATAAASTAA
ncbi:type IV pili methyl-accepting chemotaxis transducer N-terminal domain-containing protein [uncultured Azohydromonas sp.]|jgi:Signal transduction histidine kinase, nitrate/nitrite-specific|uniref:type IV pili methyl-accepting chemotaxis transducer N-terminal domain-containing protein n=1 Tax=uncultured Azohydromonas sp. TaxID=487342 RepID=UPI00260B3678|nr:type IV pili methyl-accepting chemotaxis transducer N-terminal domain-containing protein [uncultured Azohydromonas sp.]